MTEVETREIRFNQTTIGRIANDLKKIHEASPEHDETVKDIVKAFGRFYDHHRMATSEYVPLEKVMLKKIFGEQ